MANITINRAYFIGRLARDPNTGTTKNGKKYANFQIICSDEFKEDKTDLIPLQTWDKLAEIVEKYLHKGNLVYVEGSIKTLNHQNADGKWVNNWHVNVSRLRMLPSSNQKVDKNDDLRSIYDGIHSNYDDTEVADNDGIITMADLPY